MSTNLSLSSSMTGSLPPLHRNSSPITYEKDPDELLKEYQNRQIITALQATPYSSPFTRSQTPSSSEDEGRIAKTIIRKTAQKEKKERKSPLKEKVRRNLPPSDNIIQSLAKMTSLVSLVAHNTITFTFDRNRNDVSATNPVFKVTMGFGRETFPLWIKNSKDFIRAIAVSEISILIGDETIIPAKPIFFPRITFRCGRRREEDIAYENFSAILQISSPKVHNEKALHASSRHMICPPEKETLWGIAFLNALAMAFSDDGEHNRFEDFVTPDLETALPTSTSEFMIVESDISSIFNSALTFIKNSQSDYLLFQRIPTVVKRKFTAFANSKHLCEMITMKTHDSITASRTKLNEEQCSLLREVIGNYIARFDPLLKTLSEENVTYYSAMRSLYPTYLELAEITAKSSSERDLIFRIKHDFGEGSNYLRSIRKFIEQFTKQRESLEEQNAEERKLLTEKISRLETILKRISEEETIPDLSHFFATIT